MTNRPEPSEGPPSTPGLVLDPEAFERLRSWGGVALLDRMIGLFLELGPERIGAIQEGLERRDLEQLERTAHSLKSSAGNLGADQLRQAAGRLEAAAGAGKVEEVGALAEDLVVSYRITTTALERRRPGASEAPTGTEPSMGGDT